MPDLDETNSTVLNTLSSPDGQRGYNHAIDDLVEWYGSEPRLSFSRTVVLRCSMRRESRNLAPGTITCVSALSGGSPAKPRTAGYCSPDLAAGICRIKGARKLGVRLGNWLATEQANTLWQTPPDGTLKGKRGRALPAMMLACGLRRHKAVSLEMATFSGGRNTGRSSTFTARLATPGLFRFRTG